jgi:hypothetical protein
MLGKVGEQRAGGARHDQRRREVRHGRELLEVERPQPPGLRQQRVPDRQQQRRHESEREHAQDVADDAQDQRDAQASVPPSPNPSP